MDPWADDEAVKTEARGIRTMSVLLTVVLVVAVVPVEVLFSLLYAAVEAPTAQPDNAADADKFWHFAGRAFVACTLFDVVALIVLAIALLRRPRRG